jgi:hypothetical protein
MRFLAFLDRFSLPVFRRPPVNDVASEIAAALKGVAEAIETHAAVMASLAAVEHSKSYPDQRDMAEVIFADAKQRFVELMKHAGPEREKRLNDWIDGLCKGKRR